MIDIKHGYKAFGTQMIFEDISLLIKDPGIYCIVGKSGSGKSTLLNMIAGYEKLDQGELSVDSSLTTIFQNYELIDELTIYDNIYLERYEDRYAKKMIEQLGLQELLNRYPNELSGGQKQRVGIVRALINQPLIICCDEPTESLDVTNKEVVMRLLKEYAKNHIVLLVTHQVDTVIEYADCIIEIEDHNLVVEKILSK